MTAVAVPGLDGVLKKLAGLPYSIRAKVEKGALKEALEPVRIMAQAILHDKTKEKTGNLAASLKTRTRDRDGKIAGEVVAAAPHAHLVEYGHKIVTGGKLGMNERGKDTGKTVPPHPFLRPAAEEMADLVIERVATAIEAEIAKLEERGGGA